MGVSYGRGHGFVIAKRRVEEKAKDKGLRNAFRRSKSRSAEGPRSSLLWTAPSYFEIMVGGGTSGFEWGALPLPGSRLWRERVKRSLPSKPCPQGILVAGQHRGPPPFTLMAHSAGGLKALLSHQQGCLGLLGLKDMHSVWPHASVLCLCAEEEHAQAQSPQTQCWRRSSTVQPQQCCKAASACLLASSHTHAARWPLICVAVQAEEWEVEACPHRCSAGGVQALQGTSKAACGHMQAHGQAFSVATCTDLYWPSLRRKKRWWRSSQSPQTRRWRQSSASRHQQGRLRLHASSQTSFSAWPCALT